MEQTRHHKTNIVTVDFFVHPITVEKISRSVRNSDLIPLVAVFVFFVLVTDPSGMASRHPYFVIAALWAMFFGFYVILSAFLVSILARLSRTLALPLVPLPIVAFVVVFTLTVTGDIITSFVENRAWDLWFSWREIFTYFILTQLLELVVLAEYKPTPVQHSDDGEKTRLSIAENVFLIEDIHAISAQEHYVLIQLKNREQLIRYPFSKVIDMIPNGYGVQVHRSLWLSSTVASHLISEGRNHFVVDRSGKQWKVARSRLEKVREWFNKETDLD